MNMYIVFLSKEWEEAIRSYRVKHQVSLPPSLFENEAQNAFNLGI